MRKMLFAAIAVGIALDPSVTIARGRFVKLPKLDGKSNTLKVRFVRYDGSTNGKMIIDVKNTGRRSQTFTPRGLFFVPNGDPERAPQRLGATGHFYDGQGRVKQKVRIRPGATVRLKLQVFCIDSHRSSPSSSQGFHIARKRMPKRLRSKIVKGANKIIRRKASLPAANDEIQSHVWKSRNGKWIKLEGERKNEKSSSGQTNRIQRRPMRRRYLPNQIVQ